MLVKRVARAFCHAEFISGGALIKVFYTKPSSLHKRHYKLYHKSLSKVKLQKHLTKLKKLNKYKIGSRDEFFGAIKDAFLSVLGANMDKFKLYNDIVLELILLLPRLIKWDEKARKIFFKGE